MNVHIYGPQFSNFVRSVQWVCEEKGIAYTLGFELDGKPVEFRGPEHSQWHPYNKVPVLIHNGCALGETSAICRYLDDNFPGTTLTPVDPWQKAEVDAWCQLLSIYIDKAVVRDYLLELVFPKGEDGKPRADVLAAGKPAAIAALNIVAEKLASNRFLFGDQPTLADAIAAPIVCYATGLPAALSLVASESPLHDYAKRMMASASGKKVFLVK
ncbi:hypothetical protein R50072_37670 [Simiduia litorea]|uniref:glutathione S-transferase family protein n=1 Tax=Simiduia litorea TaxID=1435348 RepID=UPI0036F331A8